MWTRDEFARQFFDFLHRRLTGFQLLPEGQAFLKDDLPEQITPTQLWQVMRSVVKSHTKRQPGFVYPIDFRQKMPTNLSIGYIAEEFLKITLHVIRIQPGYSAEAKRNSQEMTIECLGHRQALADILVEVELHSLFRTIAHGDFGREHSKLCSQALKRTMGHVNVSASEHIH